MARQEIHEAPAGAIEEDRECRNGMSVAPSGADFLLLNAVSPRLAPWATFSRHSVAATPFSAIHRLCALINIRRVKGAVLSRVRRGAVSAARGARPEGRAPEGEGILGRKP